MLPVVVPQEGQRIPSVLPEKLHLAGFRHPDTHHVAHTLDFLEEGVLQFPHPFAGPGQSLDLTAEIVNQAVKDFHRLLFAAAGENHTGVVQFFQLASGLVLLVLEKFPAPDKELLEIQGEIGFRRPLVPVLQKTADFRQVVVLRALLVIGVNTPDIAHAFQGQRFPDLRHNFRQLVLTAVRPGQNHQLRNVLPEGLDEVNIVLGNHAALRVDEPEDQSRCIELPPGDLLIRPGRILF